jgi:hypothetical protein
MSACGYIAVVAQIAGHDISKVYRDKDVKYYGCKTRTCELPNGLGYSYKIPRQAYTPYAPHRTASPNQEGSALRKAICAHTPNILLPTTTHGDIGRTTNILTLT